MFCIVGLGNPGIQYRETRHNAGFLAIEALAGRFGVQGFKQGFFSHYQFIMIGGEKVLLAKPQTFMNLSGQAVQALLSYYKVDPAKRLIIYDDLDLPVGTIRIRLAGSSGGHKGLTSIIQQVGSNQIPRLRIGIGKPENRQPIPDYVLSPVSDEQRKMFLESIERAADAVVSFVSAGPSYAMNHFNLNSPPHDISTGATDPAAKE